MQYRKTAVAVVAGLAFGFSAMTASAGNFAANSYVYDNAGDINAFGGKDDAAATAQSLIDGLGRAGEYTPTSFFWDAGQEGTIYLEDDGNITAGQGVPQVTFDLGSTKSFTGVDIHYGVRVASGIEAYETVEILVDNVSIGTFGGFDLSDNVENFGDIRLNSVNTGAQSGQFITLILSGNLSGLPAAGGTTWHGLTEVEFVPEPASIALLGMGGLMLARRRRK